MAEHTPGEICYAAYLAMIAPAAPWCELGWHEMSAAYQGAWEAAAQAVLDAWQAQPRLKEGETPPIL